MSKIFSIKAAMAVRDQENEELVYHARILGMSKLELLEEMVRFQEERGENGDLSLSLMIRGRHLFKALEESAESNELRSLTRSYRRHLELELTEFKRKSTSA